MTTNQIEYAKLLETRRSNLAEEQIKSAQQRAQQDYWIGSVEEQSRHNQATEANDRIVASETKRANLAREANNVRITDETIRHNLVSEQHNLDVLNEQRRSNLAQEEHARNVLSETKRSNLAKEYETQRSNLVREAETNRNNVVVAAETRRSNVAREAETHRANVANESIKRAANAIQSANVSELIRHNQAYEQIQSQANRNVQLHYERSDYETVRSNKAREEENRRSNLAKEVETVRSNRAREEENTRANLAKEAENYRSNVERERDTDVQNIISGVNAASNVIGTVGNIATNVQRNNVSLVTGLANAAGRIIGRRKR